MGRGNQLDLSLVFSASTYPGPFNATLNLTVRTLGSADGKHGQDVSIASSPSAAGAMIGSLDNHPFAMYLDSELYLRLLVDHSVVEAFAQGGRAVATRPYCPTSADDDAISVTHHGSTDVGVDVTLAKLATANVLPESAVPRSV
jgi:hypothetical protein